MQGGNLYETDNLKTPFVIGFFRPKIYIPAELSGEERRYIILHEQTHIRRHDHIVKMLAYFVLCLHWFNPLAWAAFILMGADMEMSCDERVMKELGEEIKRDYSRSLVRVASGHKIINGSPLAFGEGGMKGRVKNVLNFKKHSRVIIVSAVALVAVLSVGFAVDRMSGHEPLVLGAYTTDDGLTQIVFHGDNEFYIVRRGISYSPTGTWVYEEEPNDNKVVLIHADDERCVFSYQANRLTLEQGAWLEKWIESGAVLILSEELSRQNILQQYFLENSDDNDHLFKMTTVMLFNDGTAQLATPPISSYLLPPCVYSFEENELVIYASIESSELKGAYGVKSGDAIAVFTVDADGALVFKSAAVPLYANEGARYIPASSAPATDFVTREWISYDKSEDFWTTTADLMLDEFPGVMFNWTSGKVTATDSSGVNDLFTGMPIWNVYLADLNGDNLPELCATVSIGSGIIDTRVIVYDYANGALYELSDRMLYDYALSLEDGHLVVTQSEYNGGEIAQGSLAIINRELTVIGLDRAQPLVESNDRSAPVNQSN